MTATNTIKHYDQLIQESLHNCINETTLPAGKKYRGKVRDTYDLGDKLLLVTTDRLTAFDRYLASIPFKGQVLNLTSAWWFEQTQDIVANHVISIPDANVLVAKKCKVFPIEFVVRGYISGTTATSLWTQYQKGTREYCGIQFPEGLRKNQKLEKPVLTPTTKDEVHDKPISPAEIVSEGWMSAEDFEATSHFAMQLYQRGVELAAKNGLILVDTKYEFGRDEDGNILLIDEIHTPDSSRYWLANSYESRISQGLEPENIDKEFLRLWFAKNCDPYNDTQLPKAPDDLVITLAGRYIQLFELITGQPFNFSGQSGVAEQRIMRNIASWLA